MKKNSLLAFAAASLLLTACNNNGAKKASTGEAQEVAEKTGDVYNVDLTTSSVNWKAYHKGGFAPRWGTINLKSGNVSVDNGNLTSGDFVIDMQTIKVDSASVTEKDKKSSDLEAHLKNDDFFAVDKNPTAEFKLTQVADLTDASTKGTVEGANKTVSGNLTLLGKTLNVTFPAKVVVADGKLTVDAQFTVNRADWGIKFGTSEADPAEWGISKDIEVGLHVEASK